MPLLETKPWIVQKYGGTSLGKLLSTITEIIIPQYLQDNNIVVVCSAISDTIKSQGTTSLLLQAIEQAMTPPYPTQAPQLFAAINTIRDQHLDIGRKLREASKGHGSIFEALNAGISDDCARVKALLSAGRVSFPSVF
jgi:aspartate kinase